MNRLRFSLSSALCIGIFALTIWSCKDSFTDEDLVNKQHELSQDSIQLSVVIYNASTTFKGKTGGRAASAQGVQNITVTITDRDGTLRTSTSDANGITVFKNLNPGSVSGAVSGTNFTTANFVISLVNNTNASQPGSTGNNHIQAAVLIPVYETSGPNTSTVSGTVTCESNMLNNVRENVPDGVTVSFSISDVSFSSADDELLSNLLGVLGKIGAASFKNANVEDIRFQTNFVATVAAGAYTITLPTSADGVSYDFSFSDFRAAQSIAINNYVNTPSGSTRDVVSLQTLFTQNSVLDAAFASKYPIPSVNAIQLDLQAPPAAGSGAVAAAKLLPDAVDAGNGFTILAAGSGYPASSITIPVTVTGGDFDSTVPGATAAALNASSNASGQITAITGTLGFGYRSQATISIGGGGTGAVVIANYSTFLAPLGGTGVNSGTTLTAGGSGYVIAPELEVRGYDYDGEYLEATATTTVSNGSVVSFSVPGTTFAKIISVVFLPEDRIQAFVDGFGDMSVNSSGGLTGYLGGTTIFLDDAGNGYNPTAPPTVTVRDLRGAGSGAVVLSNTNVGGYLDQLTIQSGGSGYSQSLYANFPIGAEAFSYSISNSSNNAEDIKTKITLRPGLARILDAHYGTGKQERKIE